MADVTVTAAEVLPITSGDNPTQITEGILGATVTAGQTGYLDSNNVWQLADANASSTTAAVGGIFLTGGASGQKCLVAHGGTLDPGFTVGVGSVYVLSATAGGIAPVADLATGHYVTVLGVGITASVLKLLIPAGRSGVAVP